MIINLSPIRNDQKISLIVNGDVLTINGDKFDFSDLKEGERLKQSEVSCDWLQGDVERREGELYLTLLLPHGPKAPRQTLFPKPIHVTKDGPVILPVFELIESEENPDELGRRLINTK